MRPRRAGLGIVLLSGLLAVLLLTACGGDSDDSAQTPDSAPSNATIAELVEDGDPPTESELAGIWVTPGGQAGIRFDSDGFFALENGQIHDLFTSPTDAGTYELDGKTLTYTNDGEAAGFDVGGQCGGTTIVSEVALSEPGRLAEVIVEDNCGVQTTEFLWTKVVSPAGSADASLAVVGTAPGGGRPPIEPELLGLWVRIDEETDLVRFGPDGSVQDGQGVYAVDRSGGLLVTPTEVGTFHLGGDDPDTFQVEGKTIVLAVGASDECPEGARRVWGAEFTDVESDDGQPRLELTVTDDECGQTEGGEQSVWGRVAP